MALSFEDVYNWLQPEEAEAGIIPRGPAAKQLVETVRGQIPRVVKTLEKSKKSTYVDFARNFFDNYGVFTSGGTTGLVEVTGASPRLDKKLSKHEMGHAYDKVLRNRLSSSVTKLVGEDSEAYKDLVQAYPVPLTEATHEFIADAIGGYSKFSRGSKRVTNPKLLDFANRLRTLAHNKKGWAGLAATAGGAMLTSQAEASPKGKAMNPTEAMRRVDTLASQPTPEGTVDVSIQPGREVEAKARLEELLGKGLNEQDALVTLKREFKPSNFISPKQFGANYARQAEQLATANWVPVRQAGEAIQRSAVNPNFITPQQAAKLLSTMPQPEQDPLLPEQSQQPELAAAAAEGKSMGEMVKDMAVDVAMFGGATMAAGAMVTAAGLTGGLAAIALPVLAGSLYTSGKMAANTLTGKPELVEPTLSEQISGAELNQPARAVVDVAENALMIGGGREALRLTGKAGSKVLKGVEWFAKKPLATITKPLEPVGNYVWDNIVVKPTNLPLPFLHKTLREAVQPAIERIEKAMPMTAATFRKTAAMKSLSSQAGRELGTEMQSLRPSEAYEVMKGLRGTPYQQLKSQRAKDLLMRFEDRLKEAKLSTIYDVKFRDEVSKLLTKPIEAIENSVSPSSIGRLLKVFEKPLPQQAKVGQIHDALDAIMSHPNVTDEVKLFAKELYDVPANTPMAVADASRRASNLYLKSKLIRTPGIVSHIPRKGYVESKQSGMKGMYLPKDVELELQSLHQVPQIARGFYQKWFLSPWKTAKVVVRPATHVRNLISNTLLNDWGGLPFYRVDVYQKALSELRNKGQHWKDFARMTGAGGAWSQQEIYQLESGLKHGASFFDKLYNVYDKVVAPARGLYQAEENWFKLAKYMHNLEGGMSKSEAVLDAMKWTFNYAEVTPEIAKAGKYAMPFVRWYSKAIPLAAETAVKHPVRFGKWLAFGMALQSEAMNAVGVSDTEWQAIHDKMPEYVQNGIYLMMPWRDEQQRLNLLNLTYMIPGIGDVNELYQRSLPELIGGNPIVSTLATLQSKRKYGGAPLYFDWEEPGTKFAKSMAYIWESLSPAIVPGGTDWNHLWEAISEKQGAPTPEEALAGWFGFKLTPVDPMANARRTEAITKIHQSEMASQMQRELRDAKTSEQADSIMRRYQRIRESIATP